MKKNERKAVFLTIYLMLVIFITSCSFNNTSITDNKNNSPASQQESTEYEQKADEKFEENDDNQDKQDKQDNIVNDEENTTEEIDSVQETSEKSEIEPIIVYSTKSGECYHMSWCSSLQRSQKEITLDQAKAAGLRPCKLCNPPQ